MFVKQQRSSWLAQGALPISPPTRAHLVKLLQQGGGGGGRHGHPDLHTLVIGQARGQGANHAAPVAAGLARDAARALPARVLHMQMHVCVCVSASVRAHGRLPLCLRELLPVPCMRACAHVCMCL